jgi:hypothetical protein
MVCLCDLRKTSRGTWAREAPFGAGLCPVRGLAYSPKEDPEGGAGRVKAAWTRAAEKGPGPERPGSGPVRVRVQELVCIPNHDPKAGKVGFSQENGLTRVQGDVRIQEELK